jgi:hypothetical protein
MPEKHECSQNDKITQLVKDMDTIKVAIKGNGKEGLQTTVSKLQQSNEFLTAQIGESVKINSTLTTAVNALLIFQREVETKEMLKEKYRAKAEHRDELHEQSEVDANKFMFTKRHLIWTLVVTSMFGVSAFVISLLMLVKK